MLQNLRDNSRSVISFILIGFLVVIFALTGVEALFNQDLSSNKVAVVNDEAIAEVDVLRAIEIQKRQMISTYGDQIPAEFLSDEYLRKPVIENLVKRMLLAQAGKEAGMAIGNDFMSEQITNVAQFKNSDGVFDNNLYQSMLRNMGYTHGTYTKLLADELIINQLQAGIASTAFTTSVQLDDLVALNFQTRDLSYLVLPLSKVRDGVQVDEAEVNAYYSANQESFTTQEQIAVDYINLNVTDLMVEVSVSEEQLHKQYEQNLTSFVAAPERHAAHILIENNDADLIKKISEKLAAGEDFAALAKEYSNDLGSNEAGGDLGFSKGDAFPAEFETALAELKVGEVSSPVKTDAGTHFIKLLAEKGSEAPSFEEQRASIEQQLKRSQAENKFVSLLEQLRDLSYNAESLGDVAQELTLTVKNSGLFERNKGVGLMADPKVVEAAFSVDVLKDGNSSEVLELDSSNVIVLKKTDYKPSQVKPLVEVQEQIVNTLKDQKAQELLAEQGQKILENLKSGDSFTDLATAEGLELKELLAVKRNGADLDMDIARYVFTMPKPKLDSSSFGSTRTSSGDLAVIALSKVHVGADTEVSDEQKAAIKSQLAGIYGRNDFSSYEKFLKDSADIE